MSWIIEKLSYIIKKPEVQSGLSIAASSFSLANPLAGAVISAFKEVSSIADEIKGRYILNGLASGLNQEKFVNELESYVNSNDENAGFVANTLRKALLADSPIACTLMGRILADHIKEKKPYDQYDVIIIHALESATDDDLRAFQNMMSGYNGKNIVVSSQNTVEWCFINRIFQQIIGTASDGNLSLQPVYKRNRQVIRVYY